MDGRKRGHVFDRVKQGLLIKAATISVTPDAFHPKWNSAIEPRPRRASS